MERRRARLTQRLGPHRTIGMAGKRNRERRPIAPDVGPMRAERIADLHAYAVDVNMELILGAPRRRLMASDKGLARQSAP